MCVCVCTLLFSSLLDSTLDSTVCYTHPRTTKREREKLPEKKPTKTRFGSLRYLFPPFSSSSSSSSLSSFGYCRTFTAFGSFYLVNYFWLVVAEAASCSSSSSSLFCPVVSCRDEQSRAEQSNLPVVVFVSRLFGPQLC